MGVKIPDLNVNISKNTLSNEYLVSSVPVSVYDAILTFKKFSVNCL